MTTKQYYTVFLTLSIILLLFSGCNGNINNPINCIQGNKYIISDTSTVGGFYSIMFSASGNVHINQSLTPSVIIETDDNLLSYILTTVSDSTLKISNSTTICSSKLDITVSMQFIRSITLSGTGNINSSSAVNMYDYEVILSGSGNVNLTGTAHSGLIRIEGSGNIDVSDIVTPVSTAIINGTGNIRINATDRLTAVINGSGNIYYKGNPPDKIFTVNGSGNIIQIP